MNILVFNDSLFPYYYINHMYLTDLHAYVVTVHKLVMHSC